jgi:hypothetical protein
MQTLAEVLCLHSTSMYQELQMVINELNRDILELSTHAHGNHVVQAFLVAFRASEKPSDSDVPGTESHAVFTQFIFDTCMRSCKEIGMHKHGCCVMQRCLEKGNKSQKMALADVIINHLSDLIEDPYGNYLV